MSKARIRVLFVVTAILLFGMSQNLPAQFRGPRDPGVRNDPNGSTPSAGGPIPGLLGAEPSMFTAGKADFESDEGIGDGVGPRFNFVSCGGCHAQPHTGGSSPAQNPMFRVNDPGDLKFTGNVFPSFISRNGPVREARFQFNPDGSRDGGVHALFVITGHPDASGCNIKQEDFETQVRNRNIIFRIPTPVFGAGLIENFTDTTIMNNLNANSNTKRNFGISGRVNRNGNDGRISRFGWKAQNPSLLVFSGEAYNVEMGITNEAFQIERDETPSCQFAKTPNDVTPSTTAITAIINFANFQRFLAPPTAVASYAGVSATSVARGKQQFTNLGCALCHTPSLKTNGNTTVAALSNQTANLYSDLALHQMGPGLADDILQGGARGDEFRTALLWGVGQRVFFLHDGRTNDLDDAIQAHASGGNFKFGPSEANAVINNYNRLSTGDQQDLLNFLRSL
jgi:CxxC motif-containing protein (DUF1111 family)